MLTSEIRVVSSPEYDGHEQVYFHRDDRTGLRAIVAIHSTRLGPAAGGCRIHPYASEGEALADALRLSRGMSYKNALVGLPLGGGKAVIIADTKTEKTPALMRSFGRAVESHAGQYITAEDVGCTAGDMDTVALETRHVAGLSARVGDPSPYTARGVFLCMKAAARQRLGRDLAGVRIGVKGVGHVGFELCRLLAAEGASLVVSDLRAAHARRAAETFGAEVVPPEAIAGLDIDVYAPCALGGDLDASRIEAMCARIVCGGANNQLRQPEDDRRLYLRDITLGKARGEPVYHLIGGVCREEIEFYCTGPRPDAVKQMGFWGGKVPLPYGPHDGEAGLRRNYDFLKEHREAIGPDFPLMVDCYMSLTVPYAIRLAEKCRDFDIYWWEEPLHPDDVEGFSLLKQAHPTLKWTTGEHEYTRYGFRRLIESRQIDILQPDVMWVGGLTELLRISAHAAAYDLPVIPHGSGPYSYHFIASQPHSPFCEYVAASPDGCSVLPVFGNLFTGEPVPQNGRLTVPHAPGFGMEIADRSLLKAAA